MNSFLAWEAGWGCLGWQPWVGGLGGRSLASDRSLPPRPPVFAAGLVSVSHVYSTQGEPPTGCGQVGSKVTPWRTWGSRALLLHLV